ncbi:cell division protein CrgA [Nocardioides sp. LMS-CY]|uniref:Cell division protein CrgA n=1 Tax=Nocardioides soli TaxID=1036020 RepID=A0A7W4Z3W0_9ACTN|nr:cell division protein CrgA [Nocardioides sp. LMS-CY]MBB3045513.1 putative membrane protein [Nocardioides soli]QWF22261.1 cell division protein CrgA [Nocardioides sp. LMS-CY]
MSKPKVKDPLAPPRGPVLSKRFIVALLLMVLGIAWIAYYYIVFDPMAIPPTDDGSPAFMGDLGDWNYLIGFGLFFVGLIVSAHPSTPLGRGRGVVVGMLACFLLGLLWICTYYIFSDDLSSIWVFNDLGQKNLVVGIAFMAVGFTFATRWE